ncbi:Coenzyme PQQ synthesis protein E [bioreactor metagenome]|uniref:Coenzyme PQQ synthesis protein E n=1 Tax=bioreactor metagenome TaxID=1076179 RepID=A0A644XX43_9ZZZZ
MTIGDHIKAFGVSKAYDYLDKDPEENMPKLMAWVDRLAGDEVFAKQRGYFREFINNKDNNWHKLLLSLWSDVDPDVRKTIFTNFVVNATIQGWPKQEASRAKYDCNVPWAMVLDLTSACNLHCIGCWAAEYGNRMNMDFDTLDSIIEQGKALGTYMYIYTGGEPLIRKKDIIALCNKHSDCVFLSFTNGTLIDEKFADDMLRVGNFIPAISVEGFEEATDSRRGKGTYKAVVKAMALLREKKLPFGISCCYTRNNAEVIGSEEYFDQMVSWGAKFCWFFTYMPVGANAVPDLMVTADQREYMYRQVRKFRDTKPLFTMDFWNDGEAVDGCIAGGRCYLHINANGDIEPCAFMHYSDSNIHEKTLIEAYQSPLFMAYRRNQPFNENMLRPCPVLDNPGRLADMVNETGAICTDYVEQESAEDYCNKCVDTAQKWAVTAARLWEESGHSCSDCNSCNGCKKAV